MKIFTFNTGMPPLWLPPKILLIMRLIIIIMTTCLLQVSASSFGQQVTLSEKNISLEKVFELMRQQTGYDFLCDGNEIRSAKPVDVNFKNLDLREALKKCLEDQGFEFEIGDKSVVVTKKTSSLLDKIAAVLTNIDVRGRVTDESGNALPGAVIKVKGTSRSTSANDKGEFFLGNVEEKAVLIVAYVGHETREVPVARDLGTVSLKLANHELEEVNVTVSTGYQTLSKERATGSFSFVDNKLLNRSVSTNVLDRLDGVTSGVIFNRAANRKGNSSQGGDPGISIRGRSTLFGNTDPLIVLDNFPYDGDLNNINPNDIESVTVLKDAAAASIWGVRAGNGVIVLTSKKGVMNQAPKISFNSNVTLTGKPDLFAVPQMSSTEYIEVEKFLFGKGYYNSSLRFSPFNLQSPVVDILEKERNGTISHGKAEEELSALSKTDNRNDYAKYFLRKAVNQQYALNLSGGSQNDQYYFSLGYDRNLASNIANDNNRLTINAKNNYKLLNDKLEFKTNVSLTQSRNRSNLDIYSPKYPYERFMDDNGNALPVYMSFRQASKDALSNIGLLDWNYYPYNERNDNGNVNSLTDYLVNLGLSYKIIPDILSFDVNYQYQQGNSKQVITRGKDAYSTRLLINNFSFTDSSGEINYPIPYGDIVQSTTNEYKNNAGRLQLNYAQSFSNKHEISALTGFEIKDYNSWSTDNILYGYNQDNATNIPVNFLTNYNQRIGYPSTIPNVFGQNGSTDRFLSYFANASYTYNKKYTFSGSIRRDESNLFGVDANQKGIPLYSFGVSWDISKEGFYKNNLLPYLRLRLTNGYNGNLSKKLSAYTTATASNNNEYFQPTQIILNPPNPSLKWERVHVINAALDYGFKNNTVSGSLEFYSKRGLDLIGNSPTAPQTGVLQFTGNTADILTNGLEFSLNSINSRGAVNWTTNFMAQFVKDKVVTYKMQTGLNSDYVNNNYSNPMVGKPYSSVFSYPWAGLDNKGNPQGYLDGKISQDYRAILNSTDFNNLTYSGTAIPTWFGSLRNNFGYKNLELSINLTYKFGYVFRRGSYSNPNSFKQIDYEKRWQHPGDENNTIVPSIVYPLNGQRSNFFEGSQVLIEKGDHIRIQDIQMSYTLLNNSRGLPFRSLKLYAYVNNLGIIWRANKLGLDPDYMGRAGQYNIPAPKSWSIGLNANF